MKARKRAEKQRVSGKKVEQWHADNEKAAAKAAAKARGKAEKQRVSREKVQEWHASNARACAQALSKRALTQDDPVCRVPHSAGSPEIHVLYRSDIISLSVLDAFLR